MAAAVSFEGVTKDFRLGWRGLRVRAIDNLSMAIPRGQIFGLLGPNGSGKSSVLKIASGLMTPSVGQCLVHGNSADRRQSETKIGYQPEEGGDYQHLTARESLEFFAAISGLPSGEAQSRASELLEEFGLKSAADRKGSTYSKGMRQRLKMAQAIVHRPHVLILDEPFSGMDPLAVRSLIAVLKRLSSTGTTVLLTSHLTMRVDELCDAVGLLYQGKLLLSGPIDEVVSRGATGSRGMDDLWLKLMESQHEHGPESEGAPR